MIDDGLPAGSTKDWEITRLRAALTARDAEIERLARDYTTARDAHDALLLNNERLRAALTANPQTLRLHLGEMTAQEMRTLKAGFAWALSRAALTAQPAPSLWRPIEEAPREPGKYLLGWNGHHCGVIQYWERKYEEDPEWVDEHIEFIDPPITHWMPLPPPPSEEVRDE